MLFCPKKQLITSVMVKWTSADLFMAFFSEQRNVTKFWVKISCLKIQNTHIFTKKSPLWLFYPWFCGYHLLLNEWPTTLKPGKNPFEDQENWNWKLLRPYVPSVMSPPTASPSTFGHFGIDTSSDSDKFVYVWSIVSLTLQFFGVSQTNIFSKMDLPILTRAKPSYTCVLKEVNTSKK